MGEVKETSFALVSGRLQKPSLSQIQTGNACLCSTSQTQHASVGFDHQIPVCMLEGSLLTGSVSNSK